MSDNEYPTVLPEWSPKYLRFYGQINGAGTHKQKLQPNSYYSLMEDHLFDMVDELKTTTTEIDASNGDGVNGYVMGSKPAGKGQFSYVYRARKHNRMYSIKMIPKKPLNSQQYSMNQVLRQIQTWRLKGFLPESKPKTDIKSESDNSSGDLISPSLDITADETIMMMNLQKCRREIFILSKLSKMEGKGHQNLIKMFEVLDSAKSSSIYLIGDWCNLGELKWRRDNLNEVHAQWLNIDKNISVEEFSLRALRELTDGLKFMKINGCIHRDLKPSNILLDSVSGRFKISDFGCCIIDPKHMSFIDDFSDHNVERLFNSELNKIVGTPAFTAPELCNFKQINENTNTTSNTIVDGFKLDVWSLGVTIFCLLNNELPFFGENEFDTYNQITEKSLEDYYDVCPLNKFVIDRLLDKDPKTRIDIFEIEKVLQKYMVSKTKKKSGFSKMWKKIFKKKGTKEPTLRSNDKPQYSYNNVEVMNAPSGQMSIETRSESSSSFEEPVPITDFLDTYEAGDPLYTEKMKSPEKHVQLPSTASPSPIKIPTPIKALIRIKDSPEKKEPLQETPTKKKSTNRMRSSKEIVDFKQYMDKPFNSSISNDTVRNINSYLESDSAEV